MEFKENYKEAQQEFVNLLQNAQATDEQRSEAYSKMIDALRSDVLTEARDEANRLLHDQQITKGFTNEERQFFNALSGANKNTGMENPKLLPQETIDRIFEDLTKSHPLLGIIGLKPSMMRTKVLTSKTEGVAEWGDIFGDIKGQLKASFKEEEFSQNKMTAFVVVPQDILKLGPAWIERFVRLQITTAFADLLEDAFINGDGKNKPIGLKKDIHEGVSVSSGSYPDKDDEGTLTLADPQTSFKEFAQVVTKLRFKEDGKTLRTSTGDIYLLVNTCDYYNLKAMFTNMNTSGVYVETLPLGVKLVESAFAPAGKGIFFLPQWYNAFTGSSFELGVSDDVAFLEDWRIYKAKWFAYGKARDNNVSLVYALPSAIHSSEHTTAKKKSE